MTTSGSYNFGLTASQLCSRAAKNCGVLGQGATINSDDLTDLLETLNIIVKEFQGVSDGTPGIKVWTRQRVAMFLAKGQHQYEVGPSNAYATTQYGRTTLSGAEAAGQTVLSITSNTDTTTYPGTTVTMTDGDYIGIYLDDGSIHWTTISGTPSTTATVVTQLPSGSSSGNYVWWFTNKAQRFPELETAVLRDENNNDVPLRVYEDISDYESGVVSKYADGSPTCVLAEPYRLTTRITLDSQPTDVKKIVVMTVLYPAEDYDSSANDIAFPQEWYGFLEWELTMRACPMFNKQWTTEMERNYKNAQMRAVGLNPENSTLYFQANAG